MVYAVVYKKIKNHPAVDCVPQGGCVFYAVVRYYSPSGAVAGAVGSTGVAAGATSELKSAG